MSDFTPSTLKDTSILVTGGAGFIGSHLVDNLPESADVKILDDLSTGSRDNIPPSATLVERSVGDSAALETVMDGIDVVFHHAAVVSVDESVANPIGSHKTNVDATLSLLEMARRLDARVVFASSTAIYGQPLTLPVAESEPKTPSSPYGLDKLTGDHYTRLYADLYDLETVALRYFNVYGPRQRSGSYGGVVSIFIDQALSGGPITVHGDGTQTRDFVHVDDVVTATLIAAETDNVGTAFNIGTGDSISIRKLAELVQETVPNDVDIVHESAREGDVPRSRADVGKAKSELGFEPTIELEEGVRELVRVRSNGTPD